MRIAFIGLLIVHGFIHLLGFAKAFGFAELPQLTRPISRPLGVLWLAAGLVTLASAFTAARWFWVIGAIAVVLSSVVIVTAWHDAKFGMAANLIVLLTILNDWCILAPAALIDPALRWESSEPSSARVAFTRGAHTVHATLHFNDAGELVDFVSDDRSRASPDGKTFTPERWSTPLSEYRTFGARHLSTRGQAMTHAPEGTFAYGEFELQSIDFNIAALVRE